MLNFKHIPVGYFIISSICIFFSQRVSSQRMCNICIYLLRRAFLSFLMTLVYKLFSLIKKIPSWKRDIIFILCISYLYLPISVFTMYKEEMISSIFSMEMVHILFNLKLYIPGVAIAPAPFLFVYLLHRAGRQTSQSKS